MSFPENVGKSSWPELVGKDGEEVVKIIEEENPDVKAVKIPPSVTAITGPYMFNRVRVFVDHNSKVSRVPVIG